MTVSEGHRRHWQQRWAADAAGLQRRRAGALPQAEEAAVALQRHWPQISAIWLFGSALTEAFGARSDIDLAVQGLPPEDLLAAMAITEESGTLPVDLVRLEALPPHWQRRIQERGKRLG
jgi:predicted nucleotidyltransferase